MEPLPSILVLGPVSVCEHGLPALVRGRLTRTLLGALVVSANHAVSVEALVDLLWDGEPPGDPRNALQGHVARLRALLGSERVQVGDSSYTLVVSCDDIDACRFERLVARAHELHDTDPRAALDVCRSALGLWRGVPYGELADRDPFRLEALRLDELRQAMVEVELRCEVRAGDRIRAVSQLRAALADDPYREHLWVWLMEALAEDGRRADALRAYAQYSAVMAEMGLPPDPSAVAVCDRIKDGPPAQQASNGECAGDEPAREAV